MSDDKQDVLQTFGAVDRDPFTNTFGRDWLQDGAEKYTEEDVATIEPDGKWAILPEGTRLRVSERLGKVLGVGDIIRCKDEEVEEIYRIISITCHRYYKTLNAYSLVVVPSDLKPSKKGTFKESDLCYLSELVLFEGRILHLFGANDEEVFIVEKSKLPSTDPQGDFVHEVKVKVVLERLDSKEYPFGYSIDVASPFSVNGWSSGHYTTKNEAIANIGRRINEILRRLIDDTELTATGTKLPKGVKIRVDIKDKSNLPPKPEEEESDEETVIS